MTNSIPEENGWFQRHVLTALDDNKRSHDVLFGKLDALAVKIDDTADQATAQREALQAAMRESFVSKDRYIPVERAVYAVVGLICGGVIVALVGLLIHR